MDPDLKLDPEPDGHEFGYYVFDSLPNITTDPKQETIMNMIHNAIPMYDINLGVGISIQEIKICN